MEARKNVYYLNHVCSSSKSFSQKFNFSARRGNVDAEILKRIKLGDDDDEQRDVASFLQMVCNVYKLIDLVLTELHDLLQ